MFVKNQLCLRSLHEFPPVLLQSVDLYSLWLVFLSDDINNLLLTEIKYWTTFLLEYIRVLFENLHKDQIRKLQNDSLTENLTAFLSDTSNRFIVKNSNILEVTGIYRLQFGCTVEFALNAVTKIFGHIILKRITEFDPATSCVRNQDATTKPRRLRWQRRSINWLYFMPIGPCANFHWPTVYCRWTITSQKTQQFIKQRSAFW